MVENVGKVLSFEDKFMIKQMNDWFFDWLIDWLIDFQH